tara:strand:+ start:2455 stop:5796 length:3342 start_codon:yes stop_codon:yes gene_type:complete
MAKQPVTSSNLQFQLNDIFSNTNKESGDCEICMSGRSDTGKAVSAVIRGYKPWLRVIYTLGEYEKASVNDIQSLISSTFKTHWLIHANKADGEPFFPYQNSKDIKITHEKEFKNIMNFDPFAVQYCFKITVESIEMKRIVNTLLNKSTRNANIKKGVKVNTKNITICDNVLDAALDFCHDTGIRPSGWVNICKDANLLKKTVNLQVTLDEVSPVDRDDTAKMVIMSYDIECMGNREAFPDPKNRDDYIVMIASVFQRYGEPKPYKKHCVVIGGCTPPPDNPNAFDDVDVVVTKDEAKLLIEWINLVKTEMPEIMTGYNILSFDANFIYERAKRYDLNELDLSRFPTVNSEFKTQTLDSAALGSNLYNYFTTPGTTIIDMLSVVKRSQKLTSYKLDDVAEEFLGQNKHDVHFWEIFELCKGSDSDRGIVAAYCVQDCILPLRLMLKLNVIPQEIQMSNVTCVPLKYLSFRGQQIKCYSQIAEFANTRGYTIPKDTNSLAQNASYKGAIVLDPVVGAHKVWVSALDYASLYPNIMISNNLSYETYISYSMWERILEDGVELVDTMEMPGVSGTVFKTYKYKDFIIKEFKMFDDDVYYRFVQNKEGLLRLILIQLMAARKRAKCEMKNAKDPFLKEVFNGKQLAVKVSCNSVYGFCAANMMSNPDIAACVTSIGRSFIMYTKYLLEREFPCKVLYGDTDSNYCEFYPPDNWEGTDEQYNFHISPIASELVTKKVDEFVYYKGHNNLEHEKSLNPMIFYSKKRYIGLGKETIDGKSKITMMGIQSVRRDCCDLVKNMAATVIDLMVKQDFQIDEINRYLIETTTKLFEGYIPHEQLVLSKALTRVKKCENMMPAKQKSGGVVQCKNNQKFVVTGEVNGEKVRLTVCDKCRCNQYSDFKFDLSAREKQAHVYLANKMFERDPASAPLTGARVHYLLIKNDKAVLQCDRAEDVQYVKEHNLEIDAMYYLQTQVLNPICDLLEPIQDTKEVVFLPWLSMEAQRIQAIKDKAKAEKQVIRDKEKAEKDRVKQIEKDANRVKREAEKLEKQRLMDIEKQKLKEQREFERLRVKEEKEAQKLLDKQEKEAERLRVRLEKQKEKEASKAVKPTRKIVQARVIQQ